MTAQVQNVKLPDGWDMRRLKFVASCNDEALPETTDPTLEIDYVDISSVELGVGIKRVDRLTFDEAPSRARRIARDGDTIVSTVRTYLKAIAAIRDPSPDLVVSTGFAVLRPMQDLDGRFFAYALQASSFVDAVVANSAGVSYPAINPSELVCLPILFPHDKGTQVRIANFLDWKTGQIDALIAKKRELIEKLKEKRLAVITKAITKGLEADMPLRESGIPWLGRIPFHWTTPPLSYRYSIELGKMLDEKRLTRNALVPYLRNVDIQWDSINFDDLPEMDIPETEYDRYTVAPGDILVCEGGEVGRCAIVRETDSVIGFQKALHRLRPLTADEDPRFMYYSLFWAASSGIFSIESASTIAHLTAEKLRRYRLPQPSFGEQREIAQFLDQQQGKWSRLLLKAAEAIEQLLEYRSALITAAVTGKLDVPHHEIHLTA